ncbi:MAG: hypothetical protein OXU20_19325, partial [Myxococcales bacterium]|nr:hypothetical protein [Myxococcales bacterium]
MVAGLEELLGSEEGKLRWALMERSRQRYLRAWLTLTTACLLVAAAQVGLKHRKAERVRKSKVAAKLLDNARRDQEASNQEESNAYKVLRHARSREAWALKHVNTLRGRTGSHTDREAQKEQHAAQLRDHFKRARVRLRQLERDRTDHAARTLAQRGAGNGDVRAIPGLASRNERLQGQVSLVAAASKEVEAAGAELEGQRIQGRNLQEDYARAEEAHEAAYIVRVEAELAHDEARRRRSDHRQALAVAEKKWALVEEETRLPDSLQLPLLQASLPATYFFPSGWLLCVALLTNVLWAGAARRRARRRLVEAAARRGISQEDFERCGIVDDLGAWGGRPRA